MRFIKADNGHIVDWDIDVYFDGEHGYQLQDGKRISPLSYGAFESDKNMAMKQYEQIWLPAAREAWELMHG